MIDEAIASTLIYRYRIRRRCRIEAQRVTAVVVMAAAVPLVLLAALWWPWDVIASVFSDIAKRIRDAIVWVANEISKIVVTVVNDVWSFAGDLASGISDALSFVVDIGNSAFGLLKTVWEQWIPDAIQMAAGVAQALVDTASHYLHIAIDQVRSFAGAILYELHNVYGWVYDNVLRPLLGRIQGVFDWIWHDLVPMVTGWVDHLGATLSGWINNVINTVAPVIAWFASAAGIVVRWFTDGVRFMLFVLEHPTDWWHRIATDAFGRGSDALDRSVVALVERRGGDVLDGLSRWIG